jgi:hypothetical protein
MMHGQTQIKHFFVVYDPVHKNWWGFGDRGGFVVIWGFRIGYFFRKHVKSITCFCLDGLSGGGCVLLSILRLTRPICCHSFCFVC